MELTAWFQDGERTTVYLRWQEHPSRHNNSRVVVFTTPGRCVTFLHSLQDTSLALVPRCSSERRRFFSKPERTPTPEGDPPRFTPPHRQHLHMWAIADHKGRDRCLIEGDGARSDELAPQHYLFQYLLLSPNRRTIRSERDSKCASLPPTGRIDEQTGQWIGQSCATFSGMCTQLGRGSPPSDRKATITPRTRRRKTG